MIWDLFLYYSFISDIINYFANSRNSFFLIAYRIWRLLEIPKEDLFSLFFSMQFMSKRLEISSLRNEIPKQSDNTKRMTSILSVITELLFLILCNFGILYQGKQPLSQYKPITKFLLTPRNSPMMPLLWQNNTVILWGIGVGCESESIDLGRSYYNNNINISNCFFSRTLISSGNGGIAFISGGSFSMNIQYSMFYSCSCSGDGGAIHFSSSNSCLKSICANTCSGDYYQFAYLRASHVNQGEYLSISNCSHTPAGYVSIYLFTGNQRVDNTNSSMNKDIQVSGIHISSPSLFTSIYCTFSNNNVSKFNCIYFYSELGTITMSFANIVHNNSPSRFGIVFVNGVGSKHMIYCIFHKNHDYLFCEYGGSLEVSHSIIDHSSSSYFISTTVLIDINNSFTYRVTYHIQFFNSLHCNTDIPERTQGQPQDVYRSHIPWIMYSVVLLLFITLLVYLYFYRRIANNLLARNLLESSLQCDFG